MNYSKAISFLLQVGSAAVLAMAGLMKLAGREDSVLLFQKLEFDSGGRYVIGVLEILAAALLLIPRSALWGAVLAWGIMTGALIAHLTQLGFTGEMARLGSMALTVWIACMVIIFLRRNQSCSLSRMFASRHEPDHKDSAGEP